MDIGHQIYHKGNGVFYPHRAFGSWQGWGKHQHRILFNQVIALKEMKMKMMMMIIMIMF